MVTNEELMELLLLQQKEIQELKDLVKTLKNDQQMNVSPNSVLNLLNKNFNDIDVFNFADKCKTFKKKGSRSTDFENLFTKSEIDFETAVLILTAGDERKALNLLENSISVDINRDWKTVLTNKDFISKLSAFYCKVSLYMSNYKDYEIDFLRCVNKNTTKGIVDFLYSDDCKKPLIIDKYVLDNLLERGLLDEKAISNLDTNSIPTKTISKMLDYVKINNPTNWSLEHGVVLENNYEQAVSFIREHPEKVYNQLNSQEYAGFTQFVEHKWSSFFNSTFWKENNTYEILEAEKGYIDQLVDSFDLKAYKIQLIHKENYDYLIEKLNQKNLLEQFAKFVHTDYLIFPRALIYRLAIENFDAVFKRNGGESFERDVVEMMLRPDDFKNALSSESRNTRQRYRLKSTFKSLYRKDKEFAKKVDQLNNIDSITKLVILTNENIITKNTEVINSFIKSKTSIENKIKEIDNDEIISISNEIVNKLNTLIDSSERTHGDYHKIQSMYLPLCEKIISDYIDLKNVDSFSDSFKENEEKLVDTLHLLNSKLSMIVTNLKALSDDLQDVKNLKSDEAFLLDDISETISEHL